MKQILLISFITITNLCFCQNFEKGIYKGQGFFTHCYFYYTDSISEIEIFRVKGNKVCGHKPSIKLTKQSNKKFHSDDEKFTVRFKKKYILIKQKPKGKVRVYKTTDTKSDIILLRNKSKLDDFGQDLYKKCQQDINCDESNFWGKLHSYNLDEQTSLAEEEFELKLNQARLTLFSLEK